MPTLQMWSLRLRIGRGSNPAASSSCQEEMEQHAGLQPVGCSGTQGHTPKKRASEQPRVERQGLLLLLLLSHFSRVQLYATP